MRVWGGGWVGGGGGRVVIGDSGKNESVLPLLRLRSSESTQRRRGNVPKQLKMQHKVLIMNLFSDIFSTNSTQSSVPMDVCLFLSPELTKHFVLFSPTR